MFEEINAVKKIAETIELLETVTSYNNFPEEYASIFNTVTKFINEYHN